MAGNWYRAAADRLHGPGYLRARKLIDRLETADIDGRFRTTRRRVLALYDPNAIALSQFHPFLDWKRIEGAGEMDIELKAAALPTRLENGLATLPDADVILFQPDIVRIDKAALPTARLMRDRFPDARLVLMDGTPHSALFMAGDCTDLIDAYVKKSTLADRAAYAEPMIGDTVLTDFFARRYGHSLPPRATSIPDRFWEKLISGPAFLTDKRLMSLFSRPFAQVRSLSKTIDLNARIATTGSPWYQDMRSEADRRAKQVQGISVARGRGLGLKAFMAELNRSKCTFSPFGYGELCWRDYEAMAMGSVVIKQSMAMFATTPDLFDPDRTYVPVAWNLHDFEDRTRMILADNDMREAIAEQAYARTQAYLFGGGLGTHLRQVIGA